MKNSYVANLKIICDKLDKSSMICIGLYGYKFCLWVRIGQAEREEAGICAEVQPFLTVRCCAAFRQKGQALAIPSPALIHRFGITKFCGHELREDRTRVWEGKR